MRTAFVILYILSARQSGTPVLVESFATMDECLASIEGTHGDVTGRGNDFVPARFVCVPIMRGDPD